MCWTGARKTLYHRYWASGLTPSQPEQLPRLGDARRRLPARAGSHPRQRGHVQPAELRPAPAVLLADRVEVLLRVQRAVLADGVLPQLGEDRPRVVAQLAVARRHRRRPPLVLAAQRLVQRRDQLVAV